MCSEQNMSCDINKHIISESGYPELFRRQYENICKQEFIQLHHKLDQLDEAIRGNGRPGIQLRLDRLEQERLTRSKLLWFIFGALCTAIATAITEMVV